jgi:protein-S-isoprenylcysteine O-methyltransferase Ste14
MRFPKPYADRVARLRVPGGFVLAAAFLWFADPDSLSLTAGLPVAVAGLVLRTWAAGHLDKNRELAQSGPYAHVRNPLYLGTVLVAAGLVIASRRWELGALFAAAFVLIYLPVVELEEQHLRTLFPAFEGYARRVPRLLPRATPAGVSRPFRWSAYAQNREYHALAGFLAGTGVLFWKAMR